MGVTESVAWLERYSAVILPVLVVAEQIGVPLPAVPALLVVGALAAQGRVSLVLVIGAIAAVALPVDLVWHELGRRPAPLVPSVRRCGGRVLGPPVPPAGGPCRPRRSRGIVPRPAAATGGLGAGRCDGGRDEGAEKRV